jgi:predicted ATPase
VLTRLEIDGFKNLVDFDAWFGPFNCIAGENGVGKSKIFYAIVFVSLVAERPLLEAAQAVRSSRIEGVGEPQYLFTLGLPRRSMRFAAEMIVPKTVVDDFGTTVSPSITFLRYELQIGFEPPTVVNRYGRLVVEREDLRHINRGDAPKHLRFPLSVREFRNEVVVGKRRGGPFISTEPGSDRITVHQDGGSHGRPRRALPAFAGTTVVSTINSADDPTILAVRRELQSWRRLGLEPTALRAADRFADPQMMGPDGSHLASTLYRIANNSSDNPEDVYARIAARASGLAGIDLRSLRVDADETRQLLSIMVTGSQGVELPARALSEGTLRHLALCVMLEDPLTTGLIAMEEPENRIHPASLEEMVQLVRDLAVDPMRAPGPDNPLRQVIVNTHSPGVVALVGEQDLLVASESRCVRDGQTVRVLRLDGMHGTWRTAGGRSGASRAQLMSYLVQPPGSQITLFDVA